MNTLAVLQARTGSSRLPGKVLAPILGRPMILRQLERVGRARCLDEIIVATSTEPDDDELASIVTDAGFPVVRGSLEDVLGRFMLAIEHRQPHAIVRLTADCPLSSPSVIDKVVTHFDVSGADYVSNTIVPTYPDGLDVEVIRTEALRAVAAEATDPPEREHVTLGIYRRPAKFRIENVAGDPDTSELRWTVDDAHDLAFVRTVYSALYPSMPDFDYHDILTWLEEHPDLHRTTADAARNAALDGLNTGTMHD